ncbi:MAG: hypothetical protein R3E44_15190 [Paracoccaceae bacterium]
MSIVERGFRGFSLMIDLSADRILIPLAIVVGLVGGAMIGAEIVELRAPTIQSPH